MTVGGLVADEEGGQRAEVADVLDPAQRDPPGDLGELLLDGVAELLVQDRGPVEAGASTFHSSRRCAPSAPTRPFM